jgi:lycopene beta-cyclase
MSYDFAIIGAGAAGTLLAMELVGRSNLSTKKVLIVDRPGGDYRDRTWCFWAESDHSLDFLVNHKYTHIAVSDQDDKQYASIRPYTYNRIEGADFHDHYRPILKNHPQIDFVEDEVVNIESKRDAALINLASGLSKLAKICFDSRFSYDWLKGSRYPVLQQHFIGLEIETNEAVFDSSKADFMDFSVPQKGNTRFMYVLPTSATRALFEYTLFSHNLLKESEYEEAIHEYLALKEITNYKVISREKGSIPMSSHPLWRPLSSRVLPIGLNGGWAKPSTGFAFNRSLQRVKQIADYVEKNPDRLPRLRFKNRFWLYDLLLLDLLDRNNGEGSKLFLRLFEKRKPQLILQFLDEKTNFLQELSIMSANRPIPFIRAFFRWLFKGF